MARRPKHKEEFGLGSLSTHPRAIYWLADAAVTVAIYALMVVVPVIAKAMSPPVEGGVAHGTGRSARGPTD